MQEQPIDIKPQTDYFVRRTFIETADKNYILARLAFLHGLHWDFLWLSLHAVEKYLKATLLLNGEPALKGGHNLTALHSSVLKAFPLIEYGQLEKPEGQTLAWRPSTFERFLKHLTVYGSPDNRYGLYGYHVFVDDLCKVDQVVWSVRRYCQPLRFQEKAPNGGKVKVDRLAELRADPSLWQLSSQLPIEKILTDSTDGFLKRCFTYMNVPFAPDAEHEIDQWHIGVSNSPLGRWIDDVQNKDASPASRERAAAAISWVCANVYLGTNKKDLLELLSGYERETKG